MAFAFGQGLAAGAGVAREEREGRNASLEAELKGKELQLRAGSLAVAEREQMQKFAENGFTTALQVAEGLGQAVAQMPSIKPGSSIDQMIDQQKNTIAAWAEKTGRDPNMAEVIAQTIRANAGKGIKPITASPGSSILKQNEAGGFDTIHTQPTAPPQDDVVMRRVAGLKKLGINLSEDQIVRMAGGAPPGESQSRFSNTGPYVDSDGNTVGEGVFDRASGTTMLQVPGNNSLQPMPTGAKPVTETSLGRNAMSGEQFHKLAGEVEDTERSLRQVQRYFKSIDDSEQGWKLLADQFIGQMKTIFKGNLTSEQFNTMKQNGQLQGLLGQFRKEVVGGGVMTEQDAIRVLNALGGDMSAMRNKEVVADLLKDIVKDKIANYENVQRPGYNAQLKAANRGAFKPKDAIDLDPDKVFAPRKSTAPAPTTGSTLPPDISGMSDDEILKRLGIRK